MSSIRSIFNERCDDSIPNFFCIVGNLCGWLSSFIWFIVLFPQLIKNYKSKSVKGLSFLWALFNFLASFVNLFFVFQNFLPIFSKISAVYMPIIELLILFQFFLYDKSNKYKKLSAYSFLIFIISCTLINILYSKYFINYLEWIAIVLWSIETLPQIYLNFKNKSTEGLSNVTQIICFIGKTSDLFQQYFLMIPIQYKFLGFFSSSTAYFVNLQILIYSTKNKQDLEFDENQKFKPATIGSKDIDNEKLKINYFKILGITILIFFLLFAAIGLILRTDEIFVSIGSVCGFYLIITLIHLCN